MPETIEPKKCRVPDCTCSASSKGSFCTQRHYYLLKKEMAGKPIVMPVPRGPQNEHAASQPAAQSVDATPQELSSGDLDNVRLRSDSERPLQITFTLTEQQCDALYRRCTPEQKVAAMSSLLHSLLAI